MFEDKDYETILEETLDKAPEDVDVRPGSIFYDSVSATCFKIAEFYTDLNTLFELVSLTTAVDEYLDDRGDDYQVIRNPATAAIYKYIWEGEREPDEGEEFFADDLYFTLQRMPDTGILCLVATELGAANNTIIPGTPAIPDSDLSDLDTSEFGELLEAGTDAESDDHYRARIREKLAGPAKNGNRQHYKTWCESVAAVERARIVPLFAGENTVLGVIIDKDGLPASPQTIQAVQNYVDPITRGYKVEYEGEELLIGDGLGDGVANIGAHFVAMPAKEFKISVDLSVELEKTATLAQVQADIKKVIMSYLKNIALHTPEAQSIVVRVSEINTLLAGISGIVDYFNLTVNNEPVRVDLQANQVAVLQEVTIHEGV